jgi:DNA replication protein DnaC
VDKFKVLLGNNPQGEGITYPDSDIHRHALDQLTEGFRVLFTTVPRMLTQIRESRSEKTLSKLENRFEKYDLVICDEFGYISYDKEGAELLFNHLSL